MTPRPRHLRSRRASVVVIVLWSIAVAAIVTSAVQLTAYRQAMKGREVLARTQARWAARAALEDTIAVLADHTFDPVPDDAFAMILDLESVALGEVNGATYEILHHLEGRDFRGPMDEHSRYNILLDNNRALALDTFRDMRIDIPSSIGDWIDEDDDASILGVEREYYLSLEHPYEPRNGPPHNIAELELVAGIWPEYLRGEDWNLNNRLDPEENDGEQSLPSDEPDNILETGWAGRLTTYSVDAGATASGEPRIVLRDAAPEELIERLGITLQQAQALIQFGSSPANRLEYLYFQPVTGGDTGQNPGAGGAGQNSGAGGAAAGLGQLPGGAQVPGGTGGAGGTGSANLMFTAAEVDAIVRETVIPLPYERVAGRMNVNTVSAQFLRDLFVDDEQIADEIIYLRSSRPQGIVSMSELQDLPEMTDDMMQRLADLFTTTSNVYTVTARGRSNASGLEVEMIVVVDRSTLPVRIIEYREQ